MRAEVTQSISRGFVGPMANAYVRSGRTYHRLGAMRWRFWHAPEDVDSPGAIIGTANVFDRRLSQGNYLKDTYLVCSRTQVVPNMGSTFHYAACGDATLRPGGPFGAEAIVNGRETPIL